MTFAHWLLITYGIAGLLYLSNSAAYLIGTRPGMALTLLGYAIANIGLIWDGFTVGTK